MSGIGDRNDDRVEAEGESVFERRAGVRYAVARSDRRTNGGGRICHGDELEQITFVRQRRGVCGLPDEAAHPDTPSDDYEAIGLEPIDQFSIARVDQERGTGPKESDAKPRRLALPRPLRCGRWHAAHPR